MSSIYYRKTIIERSELSPLTNDTDGDSLDNDLVLSDGTNYLVLPVTSQQYTEMLSSLINGAYRYYPDRFNEVIYPLLKAGKMSFCDEVLNCIENNQEVANAVRKASEGQNYDVNQTEIEGIVNQDGLSGQASVDCDKDNLFGATTQLVDLLNSVSSDVLELFETAFATPARLGDAIEAVTGLGQLPFDDALQFLEKLAQQVKSAYDAAYDTQLRDDFRCELLCIAEQNCELSIGQMRDYFKDKITVDVSSSVSFLTLVNDIIANNWLGQQSVYLMHWFILDAIIFGTEILGIDNTRLVQQMSIFWNDPDNDWTLLCDDCGWTWNSDFANSQNIWTVSNNGADPLAIYQAGTGFIYNDARTNPAPADDYSRILQITTPNFTPTQIDSIAVNFDMLKGSFTNGSIGILAIVAVKDNDSQIRLDIQNQNLANGNNIIQTLVIDEPDIKSLRFFIRASSQTTPVYSGDVVLNSVTVIGEGSNPFS